MKGFNRSDLLFSLCGLNCALCPMRMDHYCPGCGGGAGNQSCAIAKCSLEHGGLEYCSQCGEYPCAKYQGTEDYDSFISHRNQLKDMAHARQIGPAAYQAELREKQMILRYLLDNCNDGRRKSFYCLTVNLLSLEDLRSAAEQVAASSAAGNLTLQEKATLAADLLQKLAEQRDIVLKLNKKNGQG